MEVIYMKEIALSDCIKQKSGLEILDLSSLDITSEDLDGICNLLVEEEADTFQSVDHIELSGNEIKDLPYSFMRLSELECLDSVSLYRNPLTLSGYKTVWEFKALDFSVNHDPAYLNNYDLSAFYKAMKDEMQKEFRYNNRNSTTEECYNYVLRVIRDIVNTPNRGMDALASFAVIDQFELSMSSCPKRKLQLLEEIATPIQEDLAVISRAFRLKN
jgi:Leucine-rich repeat (LRR) protein